MQTDGMDTREIKQATIAKIKRLHARKLPLNIAAVKRHHPELLDAVYSVRPFWGWKTALEDAGIGYEQIAMEILERVTCQICGKQLKALASHLTRRHCCSTEEYLQDYPEAKLISEEISASRMVRYRSKPGKGMPSLPNWEPFWTPEYVYDRIHEYHLMDAPLHARGIQRYDYATLTAARAYCGGWDVALRKVGLNPKDVRRNRVERHWSREMIREELNRLFTEGKPINSKAIYESDTGLFHAIRNLYGTHDRALEAIGQTPNDIRLYPVLRTEENHQKLLDAIHRVARLTGKQHDQAIRTLHKEYRCIRQSFYKNWQEAARAAGVDPARDGNLPHYRSIASIMEALRNRQRNGLPLASLEIKKANPELYENARRFFGSFAICLRHFNQSRGVNAS
jgi:hypothetical protein